MYPPVPCSGAPTMLKLTRWACGANDVGTEKEKLGLTIVCKWAEMKTVEPINPESILKLTRFRVLR